MSCLQIDEMLLMEAARMALGLRYHKSNNRTTDLAKQGSCQRTFWVIYYMEKQACFRNHNTSIIADCDIGCPIPKSLDSNFGNYDWFLTSIRFSRILSQAYTSLFSVSGSLKTRTQYQAALDRIQGLAERWRMSIPKDFRPGMPYMHHGSLNPGTRMAFIQTSYNYYALTIALDRLALHIEENQTGREMIREEHKRRLMNTARAVVELTRYIDVDSYTPIFILGIMPLSAVFILFDFVIHNPAHPETRINLSLLDITGGHFSLLERASGGVLPTSYIAEFAYIARQYVMEQNKENGKSRQNDGTGAELAEQRMDENSDFGLLGDVLQPESERQHDPTDLQQEYAGGEGSTNIMAFPAYLWRNRKCLPHTKETRQRNILPAD
ncbi:fungal specific transcription factor [Colletotrichum tofieldiae]|nr:fungal specific transcription factor [Colletotrichum tofieldiae]